MKVLFSLKKDMLIDLQKKMKSIKYIISSKEDNEITFIDINGNYIVYKMKKTRTFQFMLEDDGLDILDLKPNKNTTFKYDFDKIEDFKPSKKKSDKPILYKYIYVSNCNLNILFCCP